MMHPAKKDVYQELSADGVLKRRNMDGAQRDATVPLM